MRAAWWLLKLGWRLATRVRDRLGPVVGVGTHPTEWMMGARLDTDEAPPRANLADFVQTLEPAEQAELQGLAQAYARTFCGKCAGSPADPSQRCKDCVELLVNVLRELHGDEPAKLREIARSAAAREGRR